MTPIQQLMLGTGAKDKVFLDEVFSNYLYTGDGTSTRTITNNLDMSGEGALVWIKHRDSTQDHVLADTVRGATKKIHTNKTNAEFISSDTVKSFTSTGFTIGSNNEVNQSSNDFASWSFRKSPMFDVVTYTGNGTAGRTVSHSLGSAPGFIMIKRLDGNDGWIVSHRNNWSKISQLTSAAFFTGGQFHYTTPTSTQFTLGDGNAENANGATYVAYVFAGGESTQNEAVSVDFHGTNNTSDSLSLAASSDLQLGTGDFTIEGWAKHHNDYGFGNHPCLFDLRSAIGSTSDGFAVFIKSTDNAVGIYTGGNYIIQGGIKLFVGQWYHFAIVKNSGTITLYINGTKSGSSTSSTNFTNNTLRIGSGAGGANSMDGEISNFRIVKGTAVYTSSFRPPTEPLTNITNTTLLCCNDSSTTGKTVGPTITANNSPTASTDSPFEDPAAHVFGESGSESIIKCGSYKTSGSGNGDDINVELGFEPQWILVKNTNQAFDWVMLDVMRKMSADGSQNKILEPNTDDADDAGASFILPHATGFTATASAVTNIFNASNTYVYVAIRRLDALVAKPAEVGTDIFNLITGTSSANPTFVSGFPVDFAFQRKPAQSQDWYTGIRLTGDRNMRLNQNQAESTTGSSSTWRWDYQNGWHELSSSQTANQSWMWSRGHGLDISLYVGTGSSSKPAVIRHGLGKKPEMVWFKKRNESDPWIVYHHGLLGGVNPETSYLKLNYNHQQASGQSGYAYDSTAVTLTSTWDQVNDVNINHLCVLFCSVDGISKVGSYTGTGSSGNAQNIGFQPRFLVVKRVDSSGSWYVFDSLRTTSNPFRYQLELNTPNQQDFINKVTVSSTGWSFIDLNINENGSKYIYYAHA